MDTVDIISGVLDGTYASDLRSQKVRADENLSYLYGVMTSARAAGPEAVELYTTATNAYQVALSAKHAVQDAIQKYSDLVNNIQTYSYGELRPPQLAGLGVVPMVVTLAAIGAVATTAVAFSYAYSKAKSDSNAAANAVLNTSTLVDSLKSAGVSSDKIASLIANIPAVPTGGGVFESVGMLATVAALGVAAYFVWGRK